MEIETVVTGALDENCYILKKNNTCLVIDPGSDYPKIKERIGNNKILGVLITHAHFDHFLKYSRKVIAMKKNIL